MIDLTNFGFTAMMRLRGAIRAEFERQEPATMEEAAQRMVGIFRDELRDENRNPACALVRVYKTHPYADLPPDLQAFARNLDPKAGELPALRCLVLLATAGDEPTWNSRHASRGHRAIPLSSEKAVAEAPMVSQLIAQLGLSVGSVLRPEPGLLLDMGDRVQNVFYVPEASRSAAIVAQEDFVRPYGIRSVIGFGGLLASGDLIVAILFAKVPITAEAADQFKVIGLNFKLAMLPFVRKPLFG
ncbi:MAG TPA: hypothetical protein VF824_22840 [Thermoanaerobaculia bacterium]|jgi:hypothetical protein